VHVILIALNEEDFIREAIRPLYPHVSGISVITQYDRDYYGKRVEPDATAAAVLDYPDPRGKIHLVVRRYNDETASRNHEMSSLCLQPQKGTLPHGVDRAEIDAFHRRPDYFWIVDADEIYDEATVPAILAHLADKSPRGMRVSAWEYGHSWHYRVPADVYLHHHFGFVRHDVRFESRRAVTFNEHRLKKALRMGHLPEHWGTRAFGFIDCPREVGMFHHAAYVRRGGLEGLRAKVEKHSHKGDHVTLDWVEKMLEQKYDYVARDDLPRNIREGDWPEEFWSEIEI
jgi:hypothetical protein